MASGRVPKVVDVNVAVVANRREGGSYQCANACAKELISVRESGAIVIDSGGAILREYRNYLNQQGRPGLGDAFFRWLFNNRGRPDLYHEVNLTSIDREGWRMYHEFPDDAALKDFDQSDQKYVAVSQAHPLKPTIVQASDHKWLDWADALEKHGSLVKFVCKTELQETKVRKERRAAAKGK